MKPLTNKQAADICAKKDPTEEEQIALKAYFDKNGALTMIRQPDGTLDSEANQYFKRFRKLHLAEIERLLFAIKHGKNLFMQYGDIWVIFYDGWRLPPMKHNKGFYYLTKLLETPGKDLYPSELDNVSNTVELDKAGLTKKAGLALHTIEHNDEDGKTTGEIGFNVSALPTNRGKSDDEMLIDKEIGEHKLASQDYLKLGFFDEYRQEQRIVKVNKELRRKYYNVSSTSKRSRPAKGDTAEQIRQKVKIAIMRAKETINDENKALGKHLKESVFSACGAWVYKPKGKPPKWEIILI